MNHSLEVRAKISAAQALRWQLRRVRDYRLANVAARALLGEPDPDRELLLTALERARDLAPREMRPTWEKYVAAVHAGRTPRIKTFPVTFLVPDEVIALED